MFIKIFIGFLMVAILVVDRVVYNRTTNVLERNADLLEIIKDVTRNIEEVLKKDKKLIEQERKIMLGKIQSLIDVNQRQDELWKKSEKLQQGRIYNLQRKYVLLNQQDNKRSQSRKRTQVKTS